MDPMIWKGSSAGILDWAAVSRPIPGQIVSGDQHLVTQFPDGVLIAVIDALGHGPQAELTARAAVSAMSQTPHETVDALITRCHKALGRLRGAVMSLASFDLPQSTMTWIGVGNVEAVLVRGNRRERLLLWGGIVGQALGSPRAAHLTLRPGDTVVFATDGVGSSFADEVELEGTAEELADRILKRHATGKDDALVVAVRFRGHPA